MAGIERIICFRGGAIGDFILTLPSLALLKQRWPQAHLEVVGPAAVLPLTVAYGFADTVSRLDDASLAGFFAAEALKNSDWCAKLAQSELIVSWLADRDGVFHESIGKAAPQAQILRGIPKPLDGCGPAAQQLAEALRPLGLKLDDPAVRLPISALETRSDEKVIWHPGSGSKSKNWPLEHWVKLFSAVQRPIIALTGEAEEDRLETIKASFPDLEIHHQRPLLELTSLMVRYQRFYGHDSGISHLAAACGMECHLYFGPTDHTVWAPQGSSVKIM